jgi:hypothetical protein
MKFPEKNNKKSSEKIPYPGIEPESSPLLESIALTTMLLSHIDIVF